jgi:hypothetical protein
LNGDFHCHLGRSTEPDEDSCPLRVAMAWGDSDILARPTHADIICLEPWKKRIARITPKSGDATSSSGM